MIIGKKNYKKVSFVMCLFMLLSVISPFSPITVKAATQATYYVASNGSDSNPGTKEQPFATIAKARDTVRTINNNMTGDIYVYIASGNYYINDTISFDERDSGTNGHNVIYTNLDGLGTAKFIGGNKVTSTWNVVSRTGADADLPAAAAGNVYKTYVGTGINFNTLYVNDARAIMARTKNLTNDSRFPSSSTTYMRSAGGGISTLVYNSGDIDAESLNGMVKAQSRGDLDTQVYMWDGGYWDWMTDTIPIAGINTSTRTITYKTVSGNPAAYRPKYATGSNARYFLQGNLGFLDQPGEYYYNKTTGYLYYYPLAGSGDINKQDIVIPAVQKIIEVKGASRTSAVSHITFSGLEFKDTNFPDYYSYAWNWGDAGAGLGYYPPAAAGSTQPSYCEQTERVEFQVGVITLTNTNNITIEKAHIKNAGMFGIELYLANQYTSINNCLIEHTGHGGVNLEGGYPGVGGDANGDGYNSHNTISNCIIHDIGQLVGQTSGVTINNSGYNKVSHVEVYNSPRRGIFLTAGYSRNGSVAYPKGDANFNIMTDMYSHHNTFEYTNLYDCQQDGGDDGAFFGCYLYKGSTNYKPNYINQMVIDKVGANPSMTDIAPNGMNLDMGCSGFVISNLKIANPQHFNAEVNTTTQYKDVISYTNTNIDFGSHTSQIGTFDDSKMEYSNIGVGSDFPIEYLPSRSSSKEPDNIYFKDDFENGLDLTKWTYRGTKPRITTEWMSEGVMHGKKSLNIDSDGAATGSKPVLYRDFGTSLNKIVTVKLFDRQSNNLCPYDSGTTISTTVKSLARADDGVNVIGMGIDTQLNNNYYVVLNGSTETATSIPRTYGWHELKWDYTSGSDVKLYIDGILVKTLNTISNFKRVELGTNDGKGVSYYDQLYIYGGTITPPAPPLPKPEPPTVPCKLEAENYDDMMGIQTESCSEGGQILGYIDSGDWMDYKVNVASAGTYTVNYRVAVNTGYTGAVNLLVDGVSQKITSFPSTGGWQNWTTVSDTVTLSAGTHTIRLLATANGWNINWFELVSAASTPTIQAESYSSSQGVMTRNAGTGTVVGNIDGGDWMCYDNIDFGTGKTKFSASVGVDPAYAGKQFELRLDSTTGTLIGTFTINSTGGWDTYTTQTCSISGASGVHKLYMVAKGSGYGYGNLDWFTFTK